MNPSRIALVGDYNVIHKAHQAIPIALTLASGRQGPCEWGWVHTSTLGGDPAETLAAFDAVWCVPATPYANPRGAIDVIRFARTTGMPLLATCGGFQHMLIEYADFAWGIADPTRTGGDPYEPGNPVISPLTCALVEVGGDVFFATGSRLASIYRSSSAFEGYHCSYGVNPQCADRLEAGPLRAVAHDGIGDIRAVELEGHPFYFGTLYQPERSAFDHVPHPLITAFVGAAMAACATREGRR
jgi:CTP synthase (UTP-ammonia lyase)